MAHAFDTGLATPQRTLVRDGVVTALGPLLLSNGLYLRYIGIFAGTLDGGMGEREELLDQLQGQAPAVLVALGRKTYEAAGATTQRNRYRGAIAVHVHVASNHMRSREARQAGDVVAAASVTKDPGLDTILEHVEELLIGYQIPDGNDSVYRLVPEDEDEVWHDNQISIWRQRYTVRVQRNINVYRDAVTLLTEIYTEHDQDDAPVSPLLTTLTEIAE